MSPRSCIERNPLYLFLTNFSLDEEINKKKTYTAFDKQKKNDMEQQKINGEEISSKL